MRKERQLPAWAIEGEHEPHRLVSGCVWDEEETGVMMSQSFGLSTRRGRCFRGE